jgi:hypothetical protein
MLPFQILSGAAPPNTSTRHRHEDACFGGKGRVQEKNEIVCSLPIFFTNDQ